ncbi:hypothetical protein A3B57_00615 [Microgenomates group bacterium RIFCSPLOWO2_01_FULL_47_10]|nr:MAG: hypothetical protein A3B57_00615 [Microgenomates group bacterium RIFCSPLOWO2_01_FULL_47_10]
MPLPQDQNPLDKKIELSPPAESASEKLIDPPEETKQISTLSSPSSTMPPKLPKPKMSLKTKIILLVVILFFTPLVASIYPVYQLMTLGKKAQSTATELLSAAKSQDLVAASEKLNGFHTDLQQLQQTYKLLGWMNFSPFRWHYQDGVHALSAGTASVEAGQAMLDAIMPYTDVLGLKGEGTFTGGTTEDRIVAILDTLDKIAPTLDTVSDKLTIAHDNLSAIDPNRYPKQIGSQSPGKLITTAQEYINEALSGVSKAKPVIKVLPKLAGVDATKRYLVLFQNDAELRPTGGFMTAYAIMDMTRGTIVAERSEDIYSLDNKFKTRLAPPKPIAKYLPLVYYWYLRDMNLSPDFKTSMDLFLSYYEKLPGEGEVDGIISIDTNVLKELVAILGPIEVPGYGSFSSEIVPACDCPQVIFKLEDMITRPVAEIRTDRKAVLGPMMQTLLKKAYDADSNAWPELFQSVFANIAQKHILFYMKDAETQAAAENLNVAGRVLDFDGDYLYINNANFGGAKSNMFTTEEVEQTIEVKEGRISKDIIITYKNPFPSSNCNLEAGKLCLNGILRNYMRILVPKGTELANSQGFDDKTVEVSEDLGKTVIEGFFTLQPQSQKTLKLTLSTPYRPDGEYRLLIQKQPGTYAPKHTVTVGDTLEEFDLTTDKTLEFAL